MKCEKCNTNVDKTYKYNEINVCNDCFIILDFNRIFIKDNSIKIFVDSFKEKDMIFRSFYVFDIMNCDFRIDTCQLDDVVSTTQAVYRGVIFTAGLITDFHLTKIYISNLHVYNQIKGVKKVRERHLKKEFSKVWKYVDKGLQIEYVVPEHNIAVHNPYSFSFFKIFQDYNRRTSYLDRYKKFDIS